MAIQDTDAERRNLMLTSIGIILYYIAGGQFVDNKVSLQVVNLTFSQPSVLAAAVWVMLLWFLLRYWQTHKNKASISISNDIGNVLFTNLRKLLATHISIKKDLAFEENKGFTLGRMEITLLKWIVHYSIVDNIKTNSDGSINQNTVISEETFCLVGPIGVGLMLMATLIACIKNPGFTSYVVPYVLCFIAILMPIFQ